MTRQDFLNFTDGRGFEMGDGTFLGVDFNEETQKLYCGSVYNCGVAMDYVIDYDDDYSIETNLQELFIMAMFDFME